MSLGRRKIRLDDQEAWVFNRMADAYEARPAYPAALLEALCESRASAGPRLLDLGAGVGHLALPLAARGFSVTAVEPAARMLELLRRRAAEQGLDVQPRHATAEATGLAAASHDVALIADALHFLDAELTAHEVRRVLRPAGELLLLRAEPADTPFMRALTEIMHDAAPRRPRAVEAQATQLARLCGSTLSPPRWFEDHTPVDASELERILGSISFIGPAMSEGRRAVFRRRVRAIEAAPVWARRFRLQVCRVGG